MKKTEKELLGLIYEILSAEKERMEEAGDREAILSSGFEILQLGELEYFKGRSGAFYKLEFRYRVDFAEGAKYESGHPMEPLEFRRAMRIAETGEVQGISDPILLD